MDRARTVKHVKGAKPVDPSKFIVTGSPNKLVQIDHVALSHTTDGYSGALVMIDHFTKYNEAVPYKTTTATETAELIFTVWIARHGVPIAIQSDN